MIPKAMGTRLRRLRLQQGRTLADVAMACDLTRSMLSKIETGAASPAVGTLLRIARALGVHVSVLLDETTTASTVYTPAAQLATPLLSTTDNGYAFHAFASARSDKHMQPLLFVAHRDQVSHRTPLRHPGEEFIYVLEGSMRYRVGATEYSLKAGDSLYFDAMEDHDFEPVSETVVFLGVFEVPPATQNKLPRPSPRPGA